jgi:L-iditol 2-dehydrogenase
VAKAGSNVKRFKQGASFDSMINCGRCGAAAKANQTSARTAACWRQLRLPPSRRLAEFVAVPQHIVYPPEPGPSTRRRWSSLSQALHAANSPKPRRRFLRRVGAGMIGLLTVQAMRVKGCGRIFQRSRQHASQTR